jgi:hypothetical protein
VSTVQSPHPYIEKMWEKIKLQHKYNKMLFALLNKTLTNDFKGKVCMNPFKDPPSDEFNNPPFDEFNDVLD